ncbi:DinB family protein [Rhodohalobacter sp. 8-1]|uniref:DinB family protein n=1 Tax=Rhodohalobacter sp. 8-1 TaxID=3131972 RepID=UPI0030EBE9AB
MNERQSIQRLFIFDLWCTRKITDLLTERREFSSRPACIAFLSHIVNAQRIWYGRVLDRDISHIDLWYEYDIDGIKPEAKGIHKEWIDLIGDHDLEMDTPLIYQNTKGVTYTSRFSEICTHLILHGQHHRAQINLLLGQAEIDAPPIDYIHYIRSDN